MQTASKDATNEVPLAVGSHADLSHNLRVSKAWVNSSGRRYAGTMAGLIWKLRWEADLQRAEHDALAALL